MMNYKGFEIEYDKMFDQYVIYDENFIPLSISCKTLDEAKAIVDEF